MYQVIINNQIVKEYKHKYQAFVYLWMHSYLYSCKGYYFLDKKCKIRRK